MQSKDTRVARASVRSAWTPPRVTRLAASEAEIGPAVNGIDLERVS